jgi:hypothetical protein
LLAALAASVGTWPGVRRAAACAAAPRPATTRAAAAAACAGPASVDSGLPVRTATSQARGDHQDTNPPLAHIFIVARSHGPVNGSTPSYGANSPTVCDDVRDDDLAAAIFSLKSA